MSGKWNERSNVANTAIPDTGSMFQMLFERSADAILLFDPEKNVLIDCNEAAVNLMRAECKSQLLDLHPAELAPSFQRNGQTSKAASTAITSLVQQNGSHRFEWTARRLDGTEIPLEVLATAITVEARSLHVIVPRDISERKRAEAEARELNATLERRVAERTAQLKASEAQMRTLVEHAPEAIVVFDGRTGRFISGNPPACRLYGLSPTELAKVTPTEVSPEFQADGRRSAAVAREKMDEALAGQTPVFEWIHRHTDGRLIPTEVRLVRLPAAGRDLLRASIIDNTERKRREKIQQATFQISEAVHTADDLRGFYRQIHTIVESLMPARNFYIALFDAASQTISFPYFVDETEPAPGPLPLGKGLTGYVLRTGQPLLVGAEMNSRRRKAGNEVTFEGYPDLHYVESGTPAAIWVGVPLSVGGRTFGVMALQDYRDEHAYGEQEKQILGFVAKQTALAIERKRAEAELRESAERLRESEARFSAAFHASPVLSAISCMCDGRLVEVNEAFLNWSGFTREQALGRTTDELNLWAHHEARSNFWAEMKARGQVRHRECELRNSRGSVHTALLCAEVVEINKQPHVLTVALDITERKRAELEMWRTLERERELSQLKTNFVSMVSHEFRTPLGIILSSAQILRDYLNQLPDLERREHLDAIAHNSKHMASLIEEVLVLSKVESGRIPFQPEEFDFAEFCKRTTDEVSVATGEVCRIELNIGQDCVGGRGDARLLRHVFSNILTNAVKYSPPAATVEFSVERSGQYAICRIRDRGVGIPESDLDRIFNAFHRGSNVGQVSGTGLGLVIVKRCLELHAGGVKVESKVGAGTTVTVHLPIFVSL